MRVIRQMRWGRREWQLRLVAQTRKIQKFQSKKSLSLTSVHSGHAEVEGFPGHKQKEPVWCCQRELFVHVYHFIIVSVIIFFVLYFLRNNLFVQIFLLWLHLTQFQAVQNADNQREDVMCDGAKKWLQSCLMGMKLERWREDQGWAFGWPFNPAQQRIP